MAETEPSQLLPIDLTYRDDYQMYGMPAFPWEDGSNSLHVAFVVRMVPGPLARGKAKKHSGIGALLSGQREPRAVESFRRRLVYFISGYPYKVYQAASELL
jgi:hypothetical protein